MLTIQEQTATTANNLANVDTTGFKADLLLFTSAPAIHTWRVDDPTQVDAAGRPRPEYIGLTNCGLMDTKIWRDFTQGQITQTGRPLDVAVIGDAFLRVRQNGQEYYTRAGELRVTPGGVLTDNEGRAVQGTAGEINVGTDNDVYINRSGEVYSAGELVGAIAPAFFNDPQTELTKQGDNLWRANTPPQGNGSFELQSGFLERSNVDAVSGITELILQMRHYEAAQRVVVAEDTELNVAANQIARMPQ